MFARKSAILNSAMKDRWLYYDRITFTVIGQWTNKNRKAVFVEILWASNSIQALHVFFLKLGHILFYKERPEGISQFFKQDRTV